ncbi:hypothetical protein DACRYDRAFT_20100 [Dacryopinax primogenitus]|uniref:Uncharacterized protein n=1 Tax=Dacryopinax primogenitus (strain DJM 731) TaxID=1858805 RepID=M5GGL5_DACPD|nr:uncharacterized protein DACRYDRAFT_20100 [Dacryopinax primogenitus]EJU05698.1 hypothetical protein DACRYDRAFT_20100 [Dacryopinax primogenitus]
MTDSEPANTTSSSASVLGLTFDNPPSDIGPIVSGIGHEDNVDPPDMDEPSNDPKAEPAEGQTANASEARDDKPDVEAKTSATEEETADGEEAKSATSPSEAAKSPKDHKKPRNPGYVNPDRVKTGGVRDKPSEDELARRMERIRLQNEKILAKREQADKDAQRYQEAMVQEREAAKKRREVQNQINSQRQANAERKLGNRVGREWDAGKDIPSPPPERGRGYDRGYMPRGTGRQLRGGFRGAPRGPRGRGRGFTPGGTTSPGSSAPPTEHTAPQAPDPTPAEAAAMSKP